jgi:predicted dehydrogenase
VDILKTATGQAQGNRSEGVGHASSPGGPGSETLRLAMIGIGWAGNRQLEAIQELGRKVVAVALVDRDADFLATKAGEWGIGRTYTDYHEALADPDVTAVSICTPHHLHVDIALAAAEAGKHILCEKPIAMTVDDATRMIDAADANGVTLYIAENESYQPLAKFLRGVVHDDERAIGAITGATLAAGFRAENFGYPGRRAWLTDPDQGGTGTWMLHGIHTMAQLRTIFGEVEAVYAREHKTDSFVRREIEGTVSGTLTMARGFHINFMQTSETRLPPALPRYVIYGERGILRAYHDYGELYLNDEEEAGPRTIPYEPPALSVYAQEIEAFADTVAGLLVGPTTGVSERQTLAIVQAGYESMAHGRPVALTERFGDLG